MPDQVTLLAEEANIRLAVFIGGLVTLLLAQAFWPRRALGQDRWTRWLGNSTILIISAVCIRLCAAIAPMSAALWASEQSIGLFNLAPTPIWIAGVLSFLLLDLLIYWQHRLFHTVPLLWRVHRMHHTDTSIDVTTALRFHPIEMVLSLLLKSCAVVLLGVPVVAVLVFEIMLNATAMFNHANLRLPLGLDRVLRLFVVTPDMHRVHHSVDEPETNSNFGFNIPWWDRLFGSYQAQPMAGHDKMTIGLEDFRAREDSTPYRLLVQPFRTAP